MFLESIGRLEINRNAYFSWCLNFSERFVKFFFFVDHIKDILADLS